MYFQAGIFIKIMIKLEQELRQRFCLPAFIFDEYIKNRAGQKSLFFERLSRINGKI
jgi:hypothetical protein